MIRHCILFLCACLLFSCENQKTAADKDLFPLMEKVRSFVFVNRDSLVYYREQLRNAASKSKTVDAAMLDFSDGLYNLMTGLHSRAIADFDDAKALFEKADNDSFAAFCRLGKANAFKLTGNSDSAVYYYLSAQNEFERLNKSTFVSVCNANLAETYLSKDDLTNAEKYIQWVKAYEPYGSKVYISVLHMQANLYGMKGNTDSAYATDITGIALANRFGFPEKISPFYDNIAQCFIQRKQYDSAEAYFKRCIVLDSSNGRLQLMADTYKQLAELYGFQHNETKMEEAKSRALQLCDSTGYLHGKYDLYKSLNDYYFSKKDFQRSAVFKDSAFAIYKQLINEQTEASTAQYNIEFETGKKEKLIIQKDNDLRRIRSGAVLLSILAALLLITIAALYRNYKKGKQIAVSNAIREQKDINTKAVFEKEQSERIRIARDLHDSIGQKLSVLKMYITGGSSDRIKTAALLDETIQEVRNVSHNLLPEELNFGLVKAMQSDIDKANSSGKLHSTFITSGNDQLQKLSIAVALNVLMIFRELMSNLIKHSAAKNVTVELKAGEQEIEMTVTDDGTGLSTEQISNSKGIGWKNILARTEIVSGKITTDIKTQGANIVSVKIPFA